VPEELAAALVALAVAAANLLALELRLRAARREREAIGRRLVDVQRAVHADRRRGDLEPPGGQTSDN